MKLGIFARTFVRPTLEEVLASIRMHGFETVQFNLSSAGLPTLPEQIEEQLLERIHSAFRSCDLEMCAVSGTFNTIHPDLSKRTLETQRCVQLIRCCSRLGTGAVSLCTGTRDPDNMWHAHPENSSPEAWQDLIATLAILLESAEEEGVDLGIEPEMANVIHSARRARQLLDELKSPHLKIILDGANLLSLGTVARQREILTEAVDLLGPDIFMVHAKDFPAHENQSQAAGQGTIDFPFYLELVRMSGFDGPVVLHNLSENEVVQSTAYIRGLLAR